MKDRPYPVSVLHLSPALPTCCVEFCMSGFIDAQNFRPGPGCSAPVCVCSLHCADKKVHRLRQLIAALASVGSSVTAWRRARHKTQHPTDIWTGLSGRVCSAAHIASLQPAERVRGLQQCAARQSTGHNYL